jgi:hypothetical protein
MSDIKKPRRSRPTTRAEFLALEAAAWEELTTAWGGLSEQEVLAPATCGEWSVKDVMNHIAAWQEAAVEAIPILLRGEKLPRGKYNVPAFNARQHREDRMRPLAETLKRSKRARESLLALLETIPDEALLNTSDHVGAWVKYDTYHHYDGHAEALYALRRRLGTRSSRES